jgi:protocatechuate 3,4-dioxygenase beta subunit
MNFVSVLVSVILALTASLKAEPATEVKPGELTGIITDEQGKPIEGALIDAWTWYPRHETKTNKDGRYHLKKLDARGKVELRISKDGFCPWYKPQQDTGINLDVQLNSRTYFQGKVVGPDGKPVPDALVRTDNGPHEGPGVHISTLWTETRTGSDGTYRLYVSPDKYDLRVRVPKAGSWRSEGRIAISDSDTPTLDITLNKGITFVAKAIDSVTGKPVAGVKLSNWQHKGVEGASGQDGLITIDGMEPGKFEFDVVAKGYARWWSDEATENHQRKPDGKRNFDNLTFDLRDAMMPVTITIEPAVTITGKVLDPDGKPVEGATVAPARTGTGNSLTGDTRFSVRTQKDGTFTMSLPASLDAQHNLVAHDGDYEQWRTWANGVGEPITTKPGDKIDNITLNLQRPAIIKGRVLTPGGEPVADKEVRAMMNDGLDHRYYVPTVRTDKDGNYELKFVRAGAALVQVEPFWLDANAAPKGTSQTVTADANAQADGIDLVYDPNRSGNPVPSGPDTGGL